MLKILRFAGLLIALSLGGTITAARAAPIFVDWTSVNLVTNVATGTLGSIGVTFSGGDIDDGVTNGSSTLFNRPQFTPPLALTDYVGFRNNSPAYSYSVTFTGPVVNPLLMIGNLAGVLTLTGMDGPISLTRLSGDLAFLTAANTISGALDNHPTDPFDDKDGTVRLNGTFTSFGFTGFWSEGADGVRLQIGAESTDVPEPISALLLFSGLSCIGVLRRRRHGRQI